MIEFVLIVLVFLIVALAISSRYSSKERGKAFDSLCALAEGAERCSFSGDNERDINWEKNDISLRRLNDRFGKAGFVLGRRCPSW